MRPTNFSTKEEWTLYCIKKLLDCKDIDLMIIRGHILIEFLLNHFIEKSNPQLRNSLKGFYFTHKLKIFEIYCGKEKLKTNTATQIRLVNKLRNEIAHTMEYDSKTMDQLLALYSEDLDVDEHTHSGTKEERLVYAISVIMGRLFANINVFFLKEDFKTEIVQQKEMKKEFAKRAMVMIEKDLGIKKEDSLAK